MPERLDPQTRILLAAGERDGAGKASTYDQQATITKRRFALRFNPYVEDAYGSRLDDTQF
jgi:hypothetical protein